MVLLRVDISIQQSQKFVLFGNMIGLSTHNSFKGRTVVRAFAYD